MHRVVSQREGARSRRYLKSFWTCPLRGMVWILPSARTRFLYGRGCQDPSWPGNGFLGLEGPGPVGDGGRGAQRFLGPRRTRCRR
jgi:hypothetical protein